MSSYYQTYLDWLSSPCGTVASSVAGTRRRSRELTTRYVQHAIVMAIHTYIHATMVLLVLLWLIV